MAAETGVFTGVWVGRCAFSTLFEEFITDDEFSAAQEKHPVVRSKEELFYFRIFAKNFGTGKAVETVGQWITL